MDGALDSSGRPLTADLTRQDGCMSERERATGVARMPVPPYRALSSEVPA